VVGIKGLGKGCRQSRDGGNGGKGLELGRCFYIENRINVTNNWYK
jgi:hypothetical protein